MGDKCLTATENTGKTVTFALWYQILLLSLEQGTGTHRLLSEMVQNLFGLICEEFKLHNS